MNSNYKPLIVAVFLVFTGFALSSLFFPKTGLIEERGVLGGPSALVIPVAQGSENGVAAVTGLDTPILNTESGAGEGVAMVSSGAIMESVGAVKDLGEPVGPAISRTGLISYKVQSGDTLSEIASYFGVSVQTIINANPGLKAGSIRSGVTLRILPTSGVIYTSVSGDTLASISTAFGISQDKIIQFNPSVSFGALEAGASVVIPGGKSTTSQVASGGGSLPNFSNDFVMPASGYNWGILHHYNAVDIANSCGTPVVAAADGIVITDENITNTLGGWNDGYGNFVLIEHSFGNGVRTRYAHLEKVLVQPGDYVTQGQEIGLMGESGDATGCHVHFEVIGAVNPFAKS